MFITHVALFSCGSKMQAECQFGREVQPTFSTPCGLKAYCSAPLESLLKERRGIQRYCSLLSVSVIRLRPSYGRKDGSLQTLLIVWRSRANRYFTALMRTFPAHFSTHFLGAWWKNWEWIGEDKMHCTTLWGIGRKAPRTSLGYHSYLPQGM